MGGEVFAGLMASLFQRRRSVLVETNPILIERQERPQRRDARCRVGDISSLLPLESGFHCSLRIVAQALLVFGLLHPEVCLLEIGRLPGCRRIILVFEEHENSSFGRNRIDNWGTILLNCSKLELPKINQVARRCGFAPENLVDPKETRIRTFTHDRDELGIENAIQRVFDRTILAKPVLGSIKHRSRVARKTPNRFPEQTVIFLAAEK